MAEHDWPHSSNEQVGEIFMTRRFWVPVGVLASFLSMVVVLQQLSAQETPAQDTPAPPRDSSASRLRPQETPARGPGPETPAPAAPAQRLGPRPAGPAGTAAPRSSGVAAFEAKFAEWKEVMEETADAQAHYQPADEAGRKQP